MSFIQVPSNPYQNSSHPPRASITSHEEVQVDAMEAYFECITTCSLEDGECVTRCVEELRERV
jgi:hypothetical protein